MGKQCWHNTLEPNTCDHADKHAKADNSNSVLDDSDGLMLAMSVRKNMLIMRTSMANMIGDNGGC